MANWISAGGTRIRLVADPNSLAKGKPNGNVQLEFENYSIVPVSLTVLDLQSSDSAVASALKASASVSVPRRPNKNSAATPYTGSSAIGSWTPINLGGATLNAQV